MEQLEICDNENLRAIQFEAGLSHLSRLSLRDNQLEKIVLSKHLSALKFLDASRNGLKEITFKGNLPEVEYIDLSGNELVAFTIPTIFPNLYYLSIADSKPSNIPIEIYDGKKNCWEDLKSYFRASLQSGDILNAEAKMVFFGNGRVGKTTLSHQLREGEFDDTIELTHGILVNEWIIKQKYFPASFEQKIEKAITKYKEQQGKELTIPDSVLLNVWDFGGQEYFHATHRLFLSNNVFYLVLWESSSNKQDEKKGNYPYSYWQANIDHYSKQNTTLLVQNKEKGQANFNHKELRYKIAERIKTDPRSIQVYEIDIAQLKAGILKQLADLEYLATPFPKIYDDIRREIKRVKITAPYLSFSDYVALCQRLDTTEDQIMQNEQDIASLTKFLHETGSVICYKYKSNKEKLLDDYVFIDPKWVTTTIYQILDEETKRKDGEFNREHILQVLKRNNNAIQDVDLWVDLMSEFELIFEKDAPSGIYIAPQYLNSQCKDLSEKAMKNLCKELPYQLVLYYPDFLARSTISRFICKYGNLAEDYYWKYGIVVHQDTRKALVSCDYDQRCITISTSQYCSGLAIELFNTLRALDDSPTLEALVSVPDNPTILQGPVGLVRVEERIQKGRQYIEWKNKEHDLKYFRPMFYKEEGLNPNSSKKDKEPKVFKSTPIYFSYAWRDEQHPDREILVDQMYDSLKKDGFDIRRDKENCQHGEYLDEYMKEIGKGELIVLFLSEKYFRSEYCMTELFLIADRVDWDKEEFKNRILPIQVEQMDFSDFPKQMELFQFWANKKNEKQQQISQLESMKMRIDAELYEELDRIIDIANKVTTLMTRIKNLNRGSMSLYGLNDFASIKQTLLQRLSDTTVFQIDSNGLQIFSNVMATFIQQKEEIKEVKKTEARIPTTPKSSASPIIIELEKESYKNIESLEQISLNKQATLLLGKLTKLKLALIEETDASTQFKYSEQIKTLEVQLKEIKTKIQS